ncbi:bifunctional 5,10-methylenetetrahydrofolate dehydrogenase/5,10-methenyltetrahydrofolate cyclohydrolase [bacterium]|nr:bifunctional 5,10-methylenetetrahydrofolate dehydrogenase/5,10-methenyltetrahydrofolate cyclohydrolase [bacterium]
MIIDGKKIADDIYRSLVLPRSLTLGIVVCGTDPVIESFVKIKERTAQRLRVRLERAVLPESATTKEVLKALLSLKECDGVIVQLPLPQQVNVSAVLEMIPAHQDVDGVSSHPYVLAPVAGAVAQILAHSHVSIQGKKAVVVGDGRLVGRPVAELLRKEGAIVTTLTKERGSLKELRATDIIVLGAGEPGLVVPEMISGGAVLIDAGTSEQGGRVAGDADPACAKKCSVFTPVPGGVGPVAVAMIFKNLSTLAER